MFVAISPIFSSTYFSVIFTSPLCMLGDSNKSSSKSFSTMVCRRRAPILSVFSFTSKAISAIRSIDSIVKITSTFSVPLHALDCSMKAFFGSVRIWTKLSLVKSFNSTRIGKRPCNSGIKSLGLDIWKAPEPINRT